MKKKIMIAVCTMIPVVAGTTAFLLQKVYFSVTYSAGFFTEARLF